MGTYLIPRGWRAVTISSAALLLIACGGGGVAGGAAVDQVSAVNLASKRPGSGHSGKACGVTTTLVRSDPTPALQARFGTVFSTTMYDPSVTSANTTHNPVPIEVLATTNGEPAAGCSVTWQADTASGNGWVFPIDTVTDSAGKARAYWTAGAATSQVLTASLRAGATATITGSALPHATRSNSIWLGWDTPSAWQSFSVDVTPLTFPSATYYSAINFPGGYTGIQSSELLFSVWDANGVGAQLIRSSGAICTSFGGEGTGMKCEQPFTPQVGHRYRFRISVGYPDAQHTDYTMSFTDVDGDGIEREYATLRYGANVANVGASAFVEDFGGGAQSCLSTSTRTVLLGNVRYRPSATSSWVSIGTGNPTANYVPNNDEICANYFFGTRKGQFELSSGGSDLVGPPLYPPGMGPTSINLK